MDSALKVHGMPKASKNINDPPEHVILLHGMGRTKRSMALLERRLRKAGFKTANIGYPSLLKNIKQLADEHLAPVVDSCRADGAARVHFVTHSLGGIIVRQYLQDKELPAGSRMVMLAPPNQGSELAELLKRFFLYRWIMGPAAQELGISPDSVPISLGPISVETGIIIGTRSIMPFGSRIFNGPNDGKVSVERAKLTGMKDFLVLPAGHAFIMRNPAAIEQVIRFLQHGEFHHSDRGPYGI